MEEKKPGGVAVLMNAEEMALAQKLAEEDARAEIERQELTRHCQHNVNVRWYRGS